MLDINIKAPDFCLPDQDGVMHKLSDYLGKKVILYFYPRDNTFIPICYISIMQISSR